MMLGHTVSERHHTDMLGGGRSDRDAGWCSLPLPLPPLLIAAIEVEESAFI